jgi:hypothetical protein
LCMNWWTTSVSGRSKSFSHTVHLKTPLSPEVDVLALGSISPAWSCTLVVAALFSLFSVKIYKVINVWFQL